MSIKVAIAGAGSIGFTRSMARDILCVPEFRKAEIRLFDISRRNLDMDYKLIQRDIGASSAMASLPSARESG